MPDPTQEWYAARRLGGEPHLEWSFPILTYRTNALQAETGPFERHGLDLAYEPLGAWEEVIGCFAVRHSLKDASVRPEWWPTISIGFAFYESGFYAPSGRLPLPSPTDSFRGRHVMAVVDATNDALKVISSWSKWGEQGTGRWATFRFGYVSRAYFEAHVDSVWLSRAAWVGPSVEMDHRLKELNLIAGTPGRSNPQRFAESWSTANQRQEKPLRIGSWDLRLRRRLAFSMRNQAPHLDFLDIHDGHRPIARAHVLHPRDHDYSIVQELFVPPNKRRHGLATVLVNHALELARHRGRERLRILLHEADDNDHGHRTALDFTKSLGFKWCDARSDRPNILGYAMGKIS